jgi:hypothetical protein
MNNQDVKYCVGVDLGKERNHTAVVVLECKWYRASPNEFIASAGRGFQGEYRYRVVGVDRCALGTPYTLVVEWLKRLLEKYGSNVSYIVVDATGGGNPVMDFLRKANLGASLIGTVVTPTQTAPGGGTTGSGYRTLSRTELLTGLQIAIHARKFTIERKLCRDWEALRRELVELRLEGKRPGVQDDLAFALALALWWSLRQWPSSN